MRSKENAHDYRYFPDPDLLPLEIDQNYIDEIKLSIPKLPDEIRAELIKDYSLNAYDASVISEEKEVADYFFLASKGRDGKLTSNWITSELFGVLNKNSLSFNELILKSQKYLNST